MCGGISRIPWYYYIINNSNGQFLDPTWPNNLKSNNPLSLPLDICTGLCWFKYVPIVVTFHHSIPRTKFVIAVIKCGLGTLSVIIFGQASNQQALLNRQHSQSVTAKRDSVVSRQDMLSARLPVIQTFAAPGIRGRLSYWQDGGRDSGKWERGWCKQGFLNQF